MSSMIQHIGLILPLMYENSNLELMRDFWLSSPNEVSQNLRYYCVVTG